MKRNNILVLAVFGLSTFSSQSSNAATPGRATMSCAEFISYGEVTRPRVVYWAEGVNHKGRPQDAAVDVVNVERVIPVVTEACQNAPQASFWSKLESSWMKVEGDVKRHL